MSPGSSAVASRRSITTPAIRTIPTCSPRATGVRFFLNDVERDNVTMADSEAGTITMRGIERKGQVVIRLDKVK